MTAHDILTLVRPFGVIGVAIGDLADPSTWVFQEGDAKAAHQALIDALAVVPAQDPVAVLSDKVDALMATVQDITAQVQTLIAQPVPVPPVTTIGVR